MVEGTVKPA